MLPPTLVGQLQQGVEDFLRTTFPSSSPHFHGLLDRFFERGDTVFKGPYVSVQLPFVHGEHGPDYFPEVPLEFPPYAHQAKAFERLSGPERRSTLVATGTGSGKTEAFLWPIIDYVRERNGEPGIKAILIYPMNALANDQAGRIAEVVDAIDALGHVRAGLYVGDQEEDPYMRMGTGHIITSRDTMRLDPPDILLTNYKMLDYLLTRPRDAKLWQQNAPETLQYLVVDELHTFDGAQGTDLACLIRRLKSRLETPAGTLCCVGTSATLGGPDDLTTLRAYAEEVFGEPFGEGAVIGEERQSPEAFLGEVKYSTLPDEEALRGTQPDAEATPEAFVQAQVPLWFEGSALDVATDEVRVELGAMLRQHAMLRDLLAALSGAPRGIDALVDALKTRQPAFGGEAPAYHKALLRSFLALLAHARSKVRTSDGDAALAPFVQMRGQLWLRELRRMVASIQAEPRLTHWDDLPEETRREHLPVVHCRECGAMGWLGIRHQNEQQFRPDLRAIYERFFNARPTFSFAFPERGGAAIEAEGTRHAFCGHDLYLSAPDAEACEACGREDRLVAVYVPNNRTTTKSNRQVGTSHCPYCSGTSSLTILGSRAASLASVLISQLFASSHNDDKKLLTFSDSVQDAAHRAGFFEARTYRFNLRSAIQQFVEAHDEPISLDTLPEKLTAYYLDAMGERRYVSTFIAPDMKWFREFEHLQDTGNFPEGSTLIEDVSRRLSWEVWGAYGFRARVGRTLEKTGSSVATLDESRLEAVTQHLAPVLRNAVGNLREATEKEVRRFARGIVTHLKNQGGILHPELRTYIERGGDAYVISGYHRPYMPNFARRSRLPTFLSERSTKRFDPVLGRGARTGRSWLEAWAVKCFGRHDPMLESVLDALYAKTLSAMVERGVLRLRETRTGAKVWGVAPGALLVHQAVSQCRCGDCGHAVSVGTQELGDWDGAPCLRYQCAGSYEAAQAAPNYYRRLYRSGDIRRIVAHEHTGLLERAEREALERDFKQKDTPWAPNLLSSTPTLEMGVDIGKLSTVVLCSVPPTPSNFVQRIGRGGRRSGNAVDITVANGRPHDLYFFEDPTEMTAGAIRPPGVFLGAVAVLFRQFVAYCFDRWVGTGVPEEAVPARLSSVLLRLDDASTFPGPWLRFVDAEGDALFEGFVELFGNVLTEDRAAALQQFVAQKGGISRRVMQGLYGVKKRRDNLQRRARRLYRTIRELEGERSSEERKKEITALRREKTALQKIYQRIGDTNTYNFLTDAGLLPNYAFPESGVTLRSVLYRSGDEGGDVWDREYVRPASQAIRELAPGARFYADGRRVTVDQVDLSGTETLEAWRLCDRCGHMSRVVEDEASRASCPQCGSPAWSDQGQERTLVWHDEVMATTADRESRIDDASESREREFFDTRLYASVDQQDIREAYRIDNDDLPFGFEFVRTATFREVNFGRPGEPALMEVNGQEISGQGFQTCRSCGRVAINGEDIDHTRSCQQRRASSEEARSVNLFLYREVESEAVRFLLPETSFAGTPERVQSLKAALQLGLEEEFEGSVAHLRAAIQEAPGDQDIARKRYLVLYDSVPGGTGYLAELLRKEGKLMDVLAKALGVMKTCACQEDPEKDGCYRCLYAYRNHYDMPYTSRRVAVELLEEVLEHRDDVIEIETVDDISVTGIIESELEARFVQSLRDLDKEQSRLEERQVRGRPGYRFHLGAHQYDIEPQVNLGPSDGVARRCSVDFMLRPVAGDLRPIAVFLDGFQYHQNRIGRDLAQRRALLASGRYYVWSLSWRDVVDPCGDHARSYLRQPDQTLTRLMGVMGEGRAQTVREVATEGSFPWLLRLLERPSERFWERLALAQALRLASQQDELTPWLDAATERLPEALAQFLEDEARREEALLGYAEHGPDGAEGSVTIWAATTRSGVQAAGSDLEQARHLAVLACHLDDRGRPGGALEPAWNGVLRLYNLFQFLPNAYPAATGPKSMAEYHELIGRSADADAADRRPDLDGQPGRPEGRQSEGKRSATTPAAESDAAWEAALEYALEETSALLEVLRDAGAPAPAMPYEHQEDGVIVAVADLGWPGANVAVILPDQEAHRGRLESKGWEVLALERAAEQPEVVLQALQGASSA